MANYKEEIISGEIMKWNRARSIVLENARNRLPTASFYEEEVTLLPNGEEIIKTLSNINYEVTDFNQEISIINPETYEPTENTFSIQEFYVMLASVYLWVARNRDAEMQQTLVDNTSIE